MISGIAYLLDDVWRASNRLCQERFFRKSFYEMEGQSGRDGAVGLPELKKFMQKISYKGRPDNVLSDSYSENYPN